MTPPSRDACPQDQPLLSGVFERFPRLKFVMTELGASWAPSLLAHLDGIIASIRKGSIGELKYRAEDGLTRSATEYFQQNVWLGASQPAQSDAKVRHLLPPDRFMWGSDYPHDEGTGPYTREHLRQIFHDVPEAEMRDILGEGPTLAPEQAVIFETDPTKAREIARKFMATYTRLPNYANNLLRHGFTEDDIKGPNGQSSDRLVDAICAWGTLDQIAARLKEHFDAGASHVCVQVLRDDLVALPREEWRELATLIPTFKK